MREHRLRMLVERYAHKSGLADLTIGRNSVKGKTLDRLYRKAVRLYNGGK